MQPKLYHSKNNVVKLELLFEPGDCIVPKRLTGRTNANQKYCPSCYFASKKPALRYCPRCLPKKKSRLIPRQFSYGVFRKFQNARIAKLFNNLPIAVPVNLQITIFETAKPDKYRDLDNIIAMVYGFISGSVIADDSLVWNTTVRKLFRADGPTIVTVDIIPFIPFNETILPGDQQISANDIAALSVLSDKYSGKQVYIPKEFSLVYQLCEEQLQSKMVAVFRKIRTVGVHYMNLLDAVRVQVPETRLISNRKIIASWRKFQWASEKERKNERRGRRNKRW